jgi:hypothetical protein
MDPYGVLSNFVGVLNTRPPYSYRKSCFLLGQPF